MTNPAGYTHLPTTARERALTDARTQVEHATRRYAQLHAAEAGIAARAVHPAVGRLTFRVTADIFGTSATLVAAHTHRGRRLWHIDTSDEWPDESLVTDHLAAAADWCPTTFQTVEHDGARLYVLNLDD